VFHVSTQFVDRQGQDIPVNFVKGLISVNRHFPDMPLSSPPDGALLLSRRPTFEWRSPRDSLFAKINADYTVLVAGDTFFSPAIRSERLTDTVWKITDTLLMRHPYFWKVAALPDSGDTFFSDIWSFTVVNPSLALRRPLPNQMLAIRQPSFAWQKVADSSTGDTFAYRLFIAPNTGFAPSDSSPLLTDTAWKADHKLQSGKKYYWKVRAQGGNGDTASSNIDSFVVQNPPLALFRPLPNQALQIRQPSFAWQKVADTSIGETFNYRLLLSADSNFTLVDTSPLLPDTVWKLDHQLETGRNYYWKVLALTASGDTVRSARRSFIVQNPPLALFRPLPNQALQIRQPSFAW
ncbi:MAG TPA: hypothetical protein VFR89_03940, partial [candidate division Zixibacteria bacterium]|nr:hypothetical protein [candidate division Zixibacteria bacterium]